MIERSAMHHLHNDVEHAVNLPEVINADEVRVIEFGHALGLALKRRLKGSVLTEVAGQYFNRDFTIEGLLLSQVDGSHTSFCDE